MTPKEKRHLISQVEKELHTKMPERHEGLCLYSTYHTMTVLKKYGQQAVIQAGSMQWPIVRPEDDDGVMSTHYAYIWSPETTASKFSVALGMLPEIHVWCGLIDTQEIVDFSTRYLKDAAENRGFMWCTDPPPPYIWGQPPEGAVYIPDMDATLLALKTMKEVFEPAGSSVVDRKLKKNR